jgi:membrane protease subunit (stomatin/prohibitin family)
MAIIDVVKWDGDATQLAWKFPKQELSTWTQLIVNESQEAILCRGGAMDGPFGPGRHTLKTENIPIISQALALPFGRSPFSAEVWFVNKVMALDVQWDTVEPIQVQDPTFGVLIPVTANGQYGVQVAHARKFWVKLVGTMPEFNQAKLRDYLRGVILTIAKSTIAKEIVKKKVSILEISAELTALSDAIHRDLAERVDEFGLKIVNFFVNSIAVNKDDPSIRRLGDALAERAAMNIIGYSYQQKRSLDVLETAAGNEGTPGTLMGAGIGLGAGLGVGGAVGQGFAGVAQNLNPAPAGPAGGGAPAPSPGGCGKCGAPRTNPAAKFCESCGTLFAKAEDTRCSSCQSIVKAGAKFCANCGTAVGEKCPSCGEAIDPSARFCAACGAARPGAAANAA